MTFDDRAMTDEEMDRHSQAVCGILKILCQAADDMEVDRDSYIKATLEQMAYMAEISTFTGYKV